MSTNEQSPFSLPKGVIQEGRAIFHEQLIDKKFVEICDLTNEILRWPIPRPFLRRNLNRALGTMAWSGRELGQALRSDSRIEAVTDGAKQLVAEATRAFDAAVDFIMPTEVSSNLTLNDNTTTEAPVAVVEHS